MKSPSQLGHRRHWRVVGAALVLLVASPGLVDVRESSDETARALIVRPLELLGDSRESVEGVLGPPSEMEMGLHRNRHRDSATDTLYRLDYPHLAVEVYESMSGSGQRRQLLVSLTLTRSDRRLTGELLLGATRARIVSLLGEPDLEFDDFIEYRNEGELADESAYSVSLYLQQGRLQRMTWNYPVD